MTDKTMTRTQKNYQPSYELLMLAREAQTTSMQKSTPVGAALHLSDGHVVSGANQWLDYLAPERDISTKIGGASPSKHAEPSVIADAAQQGLSTDSSALYVTDPLCPNCMNAVVASGVMDIYIDGQAFEDFEKGGSEWYSRRAHHFDQTSMQIAANAGVRVYKTYVDEDTKTVTRKLITPPTVTKNIQFLDPFDGDDIDDVYDHPDKWGSAILSKAQRKYQFAQAASKTILKGLDWQGTADQGALPDKELGGVFGFSRIKASQFDLHEYKNEIRKFLKSHRSKNIRENGDNALAALVLPPQYGDDCYTVILATSLSTVDKHDKVAALKSDPSFQKLSASKQKSELGKYQAKLYPLDHLRAILGRTGLEVPKGAHVITSCNPTSHELIGLHDIMDRMQLHILDKKSSWMTRDKDAVKALASLGLSPLDPPDKRVTNDWQSSPPGFVPSAKVERTGTAHGDVDHSPSGCC